MAEYEWVYNGIRRQFRKRYSSQEMIKKAHRYLKETSKNSREFILYERRFFSKLRELD